MPGTNADFKDPPYERITTEVAVGAVMEEKPRERNPEKSKRRVMAYFAAMREQNYKIEETVQEFCELVGCNRTAAYRWKRGAKPVHVAYCLAVEDAIDALEEKYEISTK